VVQMLCHIFDSLAASDDPEDDAPHAYPPETARNGVDDLDDGVPDIINACGQGGHGTSSHKCDKGEEEEEADVTMDDLQESHQRGEAAIMQVNEVERLCRLRLKC
jgi:hypothetical protein